MSLITGKQSQENARAKAARLTGGSNSQKPFYGAGVFDADKKTGKQPTTKPKFNVGGKVEGKAAEARADRVARKAGGRIKAKTTINGLTSEKTSKIATKVGSPKSMSLQKGADDALKVSAVKKALTPKKDVKPMKAAPETKPVDVKDPEFDDKAIADTMASDEDTNDSGEALKRGGRAKRACGGTMNDGPDKENDNDADDKMNRGGRAKRAFGGTLNGDHKGKGKKSGKTNINIVIAAPQGGQDAAAQAPQSAPPRAVPPPMMPPPGAGAPPMPPPGGMPMPPGAGAPPPMRKAGGRVMAGAGSGLGRLQKARAI